MVIQIIVISGILNLLLGLVVFIKSRNKVQKNFSYLIFLITFWIFFNIIYYIKPWYPFVNLTYAIGSVLIVGILFWVTSYSKIVVNTNSKVLVILSSLIMITTSLIPDKFIKGDVQLTPIGLNVETGSLFIFYTIPAVLMIIFIGFILFKSLKKYTGLKKLQLKYIILGLIIPIIIITFIDFILPIFFGMYDIASLDVLTTVIFVSFISYAILKYRFMDIRVVIKKGLAYFISVLILLFAYIYLLFVAKDYLVKEFAYSEQIILVVLILVIVLTFEPLRRYIIKLVDKVLFSQVEEEKIQTDKLQVTLSSTMQFDRLIDKIESFFKYFLNVSETNFIWLDKQSGKLLDYNKSEKIVLETTGPVFQYLKNNTEILVTEEIPYLIEQMSNGERDLLVQVEKKLKDLNVYLVMPVGEPGELMGIFLLTQKKNKEAFTKDDVEYLVKLQPQMTGAIANAIFYKQAVERIGRTE